MNKAESSRAYLGLALLAVVVYTAIWSYFLILQMNTFNIGIFDYGVAFNVAWKEAFGVAAYPSISGYLPYFLPTKLISFTLIPYMRLFQSPYDLLILQSFIIALSGLGLFFLARLLTGSKKLGLFTEIIWLLYYPNAAANSYPFHYMTLFPMLLIFGYYFLMRGNLKTSALLISLSAITDLLVPVILIFSIPMFLYSIKRSQKKTQPRNNIYFFFISVTAASLSVILFNYIEGGTALYTGNVVSSTAHVSLINDVIFKLEHYGGTNFLYIVFMMFPLFFSIFLVNYRFALASIPQLLYYLFGYSGNYLRYFYPMQYSSLISPILFFAFLVFLAELSLTYGANGFSRKRALHLIRRAIAKIGKHRLRPFLIAVLLVNLVLFTLYSPISPGNQLLKSDFNANPPANGGYGWYKNLTVTAYDHDLLKMMNLIPENATVLADFNMPQLADRYYLTYPGQYNPAVPIDYAINNPRSQFFTVPVENTFPDFYNYNMFELSNMFLENYSYGVYAQSEGAILFKHDYTGRPVYFVPVNEKIPINSNVNGNASTDTVLLSPGTYQVEVTLNEYSNSTLFLGGIELGNISGHSLSLHLNMSLYEYETFVVKGYNLSGVINLTQISPATTLNLIRQEPSASVFHSFESNYSYFAPVIIKSVHINTQSFSHFYMINLTSFEDGLRFPVNRGNDSQVFEMNGLTVWNQIENSGKFEFGFRNKNFTISQYLMPYAINTGRWVLIEATFDMGYLAIFVDGPLLFSGQIFPYGSSVGNNSYLEIGGAHPFLNGNKTYPNSNPLNASITDFVILNGTMTLQELQNPLLLLNNITKNPRAAFYDSINSSKEK